MERLPSFYRAVRDNWCKSWGHIFHKSYSIQSEDNSNVSKLGTTWVFLSSTIQLCDSCNATR